MREIKKFKCLLVSHGLEVRAIRSGHNGVYKNGIKIYAYAGSPKNAHQAVDNNIKDLVRAGHLPELIYNGKKYRGKAETSD